MIGRSRPTPTSTAAVVFIAALISTTWYCGLALLFSHRSAQTVFAKAKTWIEATMGVILIGIGGRLLLGR